MSDHTERRYYVAHKGHKYGPLSLAELASRRLTDDMRAWHEHLPEWVPITEIAELRPYVRGAAAHRTIDPPSQSWSGGPRPGPFPPLPTNGGMVPPPPTRPVGGRVKFLGVTSIVLASLGLMCVPLAIFGNLFTPLLRAEIVIQRSVVAAILLLVSIAMLVAGIGLLRQRRWGRTVGQACSIVCIVTYLAAIALDVVFILLPLLNEMSKPNPDETVWPMLIGCMLGWVISIACVAWHATNFSMLNSAAVRSSLE